MAVCLHVSTAAASVVSNLGAAARKSEALQAARTLGAPPARKSSSISIAACITFTAAAAPQTDRNLHVLEAAALLQPVSAPRACVRALRARVQRGCLIIGASANSAKGKINTALSAAD